MSASTHYKGQSMKATSDLDTEELENQNNVKLEFILKNVKNI
jgi:hypothetical protein